jgi:nitrite reductase/ring-hydroxylating ferredoxin subunit/uncharacterized membrane protein
MDIRHRLQIGSFWGRRSEVFSALDRFVAAQKWLDTLGEPLQQYINTLFQQGGPGGKQAKNFLNGTWLGHPVHPMITDVPVGAWTCTFLLDRVAGRTENPSLEAAADITLATGLAAAAGSAVTGFTDWSDTYGKERSVGLLHGLTMVATFAVYALALVLRLGGARTAGRRLALLGYGLLSAGAYVGGDEVYDIGYGVNHTAFEHGPSKYTAVMPESELVPGKPAKGDAGGTSVVLVKQEDNQIYALSDTCVHAGCSLAGGTVEGRSIICPCHGSQYDLLDGRVMQGPATMPEPAYAVRVKDGVVEVKQV